MHSLKLCSHVGHSLAKSFLADALQGYLRTKCFDRLTRVLVEYEFNGTKQKQASVSQSILQAALPPCLCCALETTDLLWVCAVRMERSRRLRRGEGGKEGGRRERARKNLDVKSALLGGSCGRARARALAAPCVRYIFDCRP